MAVTLGTNAGFVTAAPTADPAGTAGYALDGYSRAMKVTAPDGATTVTEIGLWIAAEGTTPVNPNFEVAIYDHDSGNDKPGNIVGVSRTNGVGTSEDVWIKSTGLNISITAGTTYWIAIQIDSQTGALQTDYTDGGTPPRTYATGSGQTTLNEPFTTGSASTTTTYAFYAVYTTGGGQSIVPHLNSYRRRRM